MKTKNIFKTLVLAAVLVSACSKNDIADDFKGYTLPVTVNVTREGDDATKATYDDGTKKLSFSAGDKLFVSGSYNESNYTFAGMLDYVSDGKFSGTIYTASEYTGTAEALLAGADDLMATLLPAGYDTYGYLSIKNEGSYGAYLSRVHNKAFALTKKAAVEQFSVEHTISYSSGFALAPDNAIVSFTISGLTANKEVAVSFDIDGPVVGGNVTTSAEGVATFAVGVYEHCELENCTLTVAGNPITLTSSSKTLEAGKIYNITRSAVPAPAVTDLSTINAAYTASDGETLTGTLGANVKISIADGATVTLDGVTINGTHSTSYMWAGITCLGDATIILKDESVNSVVGFCYTYPGIYIPHGKTLTIQGETLGTGVLNATGAGYSAGIGAASESEDIYRSCGNIVIAGGVINATAGGERAAGIGCGGTTNTSTTNPSTCGTINITGGTITATGGKWAPGIGSGFYATCGDITIANTVTSVIATKGDPSYYVSSFDCIGKGRNGSCGTVKFGTQTMYNGSSWTTTPTSGSTYGGLNLTISQTTYANDTWTLTPVLP